MAITILIRRTVEVLALYILASLVIGAQSTQVVIPTNPSLPNTGTFYIFVTTHYKYIGGPTVYVAACTNSKLLILE